MNKKPIVYVARKITYYNGYIETVAGYYVSKAHLNFAGKWYEKDGTISKLFDVDFINQNEYCDMEGKYDLYSENGFNISKKDASRNYADCKKYVNEQNYKLLNTPGEIADTRVESVEIYKQVINYGAKLEEKYIPLEEREQISEDVKSY